MSYTVKQIAEAAKYAYGLKGTDEKRVEEKTNTFLFACCGIVPTDFEHAEVYAEGEFIAAQDVLMSPPTREAFQAKLSEIAG